MQLNDFYQIINKMNHLKQIKVSAKYKVLDVKRKITPKLDEVKYRTIAKFKKNKLTNKTVRTISCSALSKPTNVIVHLNFLEMDVIGGTFEDVAGIFINETDAKKVCNCLNKYHPPVNGMYKILKYTMGTIIEDFSMYTATPKSKSNNIVYIVYSQVQCGERHVTLLFGINISKTNLTNYLNSIGTRAHLDRAIKYKMNTIFPTMDLTDYDINNPYKKEELYNNKMFKIDIEIPYLDKLGIKYTAWDNYDNTAGTCMWHAISKALDMSIPEIAQKIKYMTDKFPKTDDGTSRKELYKKLMSYRTITSSIMPEECRLIPQITKTTGIVIFNSKTIKESPIYGKYYKNDVCCFFPKNPKRVIFIATMVITDENDSVAHAVVLTLSGNKLNNNWSEPIDTVKSELYKILPNVCKKELLPRL